jgi:hypothetical protein
MYRIMSPIYTIVSEIQNTGSKRVLTVVFGPESRFI